MLIKRRHDHPRYEFGKEVRTLGRHDFAGFSEQFERTHRRGLKNQRQLELTRINHRLNLMIVGGVPAREISSR